jgi:hypothetical protein
VEWQLSPLATFVTENLHEAKSPPGLADGVRRLIRAAVLVCTPSEAVLEACLREHPKEPCCSFCSTTPKQRKD